MFPNLRHDFGAVNAINPTKNNARLGIGPSSKLYKESTRVF